MHSHSNELGAIHLDLHTVVEQVKVQKEMILGLEDKIVSVKACRR